MSTTSTARNTALGFPGAMEMPHFHRASFRVNKKIFATLDEKEQKMVVKLPLADHASCIEMQPDIFHSVGWEHQGWTGIHLQQIADDQLLAMIEMAWKNVATRSEVRAYEEQS